MSTIVCFLFLLSFDSSEHKTLEDLPDIIATNIREQCLKETDFNKGLMERPDLDRIEKDLNAKCYVRCMMLKTGILNGSNSIQIDSIKQALNVGDDHEAISHALECQGIEMPDPCETAYAIHKCLNN